MYLIYHAPYRLPAKVVPSSHTSESPHPAPRSAPRRESEQYQQPMSDSKRTRTVHREGEKVWCPDSSNVWQLGTVMEDKGDTLMVLLPGSEDEEPVNVNETHPFDPTHGMDLNNISEMDNLHQAPLLDLLRRRYLDDKIYTYTGDILISINPYKNIPLLYNFPEIETLSKRENPVPHVYTTAHGAYQAMRKDGKCQSILVSGESGAGKTEASKYIMRYLANISVHGKRAPTSTRSNRNESATVEQCVLQSNPVLEAFGNAKTIRNDNSSRFGKFIKIYYDDDGIISGAMTSHFLLEKSRIVGCAEAERNYHIFYQICAGLSTEDKASLKLKNAQDYYYLNQGNCVVCPEINDKKEFKEVVDAMGTIGIDASLQKTIFKLVAIVLHLGNINFTENAKFEAQCSSPEDIANLAGLMQVTSTDLEFALTKRTMSAGARGSVAEISLTAVEAAKSRNGLAKDIFSKLFDWLVGQINRSTQEMTTNTAGPNSPAITSKFIGILDIFGFEILQNNSFEQLCINYTNEMLQQQFNQHVFVYEQEVYVDEGIDFSRLEFKDNGPCLDLIDKKPMGILPLLDEQAMLGRTASDENFIQKLDKIHLPAPGSNTTTYYSKPRFSNEQFIVHHYAGEVTYNVTGFLDKNNDSLHNDLISLMDGSTDQFLRELFPLSPEEKAAKNAPPGPKRQLRKASNKMTGTMTVGRKFREQMAGLMLELKQTAPSFVRCVKPNNLRFPQGWNATLILNQLIYLGVMETVRIRRSGFPVRRMFQEFATNYEILTRTAKVSKTQRSNLTPKQWCELILKHLERENWQLGHKKVFLRDGQLRILDNEARRITSQAARTIQKYARRMIQRKKYLAIRKQIILIQSCVRMHHARTRFQRIKHQVTLLNALARQFVQRRKFLRARHAAIKIQSVYRGRQARKLAKYLRESPKAATKINAMVRQFLARRKFLKHKKSATVVASLFRMHKQRLLYLKQRHSGALISAQYRGYVARRKYHQYQQAAIVLHAVGRGFVARLKYGKKARERAIKRRRAQSLIGRRVLGWFARVRFLRARRRVIMIQARVRANRVRTEYLRGREATINSQAMIRRALVRRRFLREKKMATRIESFARMILARRQYELARKRIILIQSLWRMQSSKKKFQQAKKGIILLQSLWRSRVQRTKYLRQAEQIKCLQAFIRMANARNRFLMLKKAATVLQSSIRRFMARKHFIKARRGVIRLQARQRGIMARQTYRSKRHKIIMVQSMVRTCLARKKAALRRRALARVLSVIKVFVSRVRLRNRTKAMYEAAAVNDLTAILHLSQETPGMLRIRDRFNNQVSLVHVAALNGDLNLARYVLEETPTMEDMVYGRDSFGNTPLHYACHAAHLDMVRQLAEVANRNSSPSSDGTCTNFGSDLHDRLSMSPQAMNDNDRGMLDKSASMCSPSLNAVDPRARGMQQPFPAPTPRSSLFMGGRNESMVPAKRVNRRLVTTPSANPRRQLGVVGAVPLPMSMQVPVLKEGFLKKADGIYRANKRYVVVDEVCLAYYKLPKDRIPLRLVELCDVTISRLSHCDNSFEIKSPRLKCSKNPEGTLTFAAESEQEVHEWMSAIRKCPGVRVRPSVPPFEKMICIDSLLRREFVNMKNKLGLTPLHLTVQNEDEGFEAVKTAVWLIENGADVNAPDALGDTPLHYAVTHMREDFVEVLMRKGADPSIKNEKGMTAVDLAGEDEMRALMDVQAVAAKSAGREPLQKPPARLADSTYVSVFIGAVAVAIGPAMETPYFRLTVVDEKYRPVEKPQLTPNSLIQDGCYMWYGNTWYLQMPMEHLRFGCKALMELMYHNYRTEKDEVACWGFVYLDLDKVSSSFSTMKMYAPPVGTILAPIPGDSFLQLEIKVHL